eukprot:NODE_111_length_18624_cov_1.285020.p15 type:complete len:140 gc:universal NODE_111_length_18624_cov_1.285020:5870-5451(-)
MRIFKASSLAQGCMLLKGITSFDSIETILNQVGDASLTLTKSFLFNERIAPALSASEIEKLENISHSNEVRKWVESIKNLQKCYLKYSELYLISLHLNLKNNFNEMLAGRSSEEITNLLFENSNRIRLANIKLRLPNLN